MMNTAKGVGKNVEAAIEDALAQLGATQDQVTIKIISEGGLFKKAQVEVTLDEAEKTGKVVSFDEEEPAETTAPLKKEKKQKPKVEIKELDAEPKQPAAKAPAQKQTAAAKPAAPVAQKSATKKESTKAAAQTSTQQKPERKAGVDDKTAEKLLSEMVGEILKYVKGEGLELSFSFDDRAISISITGAKLGSLIGVNGETLNALQNYLNTSAGTVGITKRIRVDIGGYKHQKEDKLAKMAEKAYQIAIKSGKYKFDPMPARERRIIHVTLQDREDVTTYSKGNEPRRFVIVEKKREN